MDDRLAGELKSFFQRGVADFIDPDGQFQSRLLARARGQQTASLNIKFGVDPTRPDIHLGHAVVLRKLRELQDWGCRVIFVIGDYTAQIGDPSGRSQLRPELDVATIESNLKTYLEQVSKILLTDKKVFTWIRNSDWYTTVTDLQLPANSKVKFHDLELDANSLVGKALVFERTRMQLGEAAPRSPIATITLRGFLWTLRHLTHARLIERDLFQKRLQAGGELYLHELMYPVLQGIDSHVLANIYGSCDLEIGGSDQVFNMLLGREVMKINRQTPQAVLAVRLLEGLDGQEKMSKSAGNFIAITASADELYGQLMSLPDSSIVNYFELCTYAPLGDIAEIKKSLSLGKKNPRDFKNRLAQEVVAIYHGQAAAAAAAQNFSATFKEGKGPSQLPTRSVKKGSPLVEILLAAGLVKSRADFRRLVLAGAIEEIGGAKIEAADYFVERSLRLRIGKKKFIFLEIAGH